MQLGSGSLDLRPSVTYRYSADQWSVGVQASGVIRTMENWQDFELGDRFDLTTWVGWQPTQWLVLNAGFSYMWQDTLSGTQSDVAQSPPFAPARLTVPTAFGANYGGERIESILGVNFLFPEGTFGNHELGVDVRLPLWQDVNGYQLGMDYTVSAGWKIRF